ncbi:MAG: SPOR domain-containing protein [Candidatus Omnitrophota bacterium]|jgi:cell division protein FtsN|nr:SPOR domain-containing protein [Candidatus Omnitrophota bacterium]
MESEKYQKELFEFESPKKVQARFGNIFPRADFAITLTPEKMVFAAIGIIMLMVIFFALGVEKGKSSNYTEFTTTKTTAKNTAAEQVLPVNPVPAPIVVTKSVAATNITPRTKTPVSAVKPRAVFDKTRPYMVVAGAFSREDFALKEVGKLKAAGLEAFVYYGEPYYLACVGSFPNKDAARRTLNKVRQMHRDAYVRSR